MKLSNGEDIRSIVANSYTVSFNSLASSKLGLTSMLILYPNKLAINLHIVAVYFTGKLNTFPL